MKDTFNNIFADGQVNAMIFNGSGQSVSVMNLRSLLHKEGRSDTFLCCEQKIIIEDYNLDKIDLSYMFFRRGISFRNCKIKKVACFYSTFEPDDDGYSFAMCETESEEFESISCTFKGEAILSTCRSGLVKKIEFSECQIENILLKDIVLDRNGVISFNGKNSKIFASCEIRDCVIIKGVIDIRTIVQDLKLYGINNISCPYTREWNRPHLSSVEFHEADIKMIRFFNSNINRICANNTIVENILQQNTIFDVLQDDAPRLLRDAALKNNDDILVLKYTGEVYDRLLKESSTHAIRKLADKISNNSNIPNKHRSRYMNSIGRNIKEAVTLLICSVGSSERIMLWFNKYSNDFNRSWVSGIRFTLIVTMGFYFLLNFCGMEESFFIIDFKFRGFDQVLLGFISLLDIAGWSDSTKLFNLTPIGKVILFFAKLFITYGIWQTLYAFYKYKK